MRVRDVRNQPTSLLVIDEEKRPKGKRRGGLFGWRDSFHVPLFFFVFSVLIYLYLSCAFPAYVKAVLLFKFNPFVQQIPTNREHVDTHFQTVAKLSAPAQVALMSSKPIPGFVDAGTQNELFQESVVAGGAGSAAPSVSTLQPSASVSAGVAVPAATPSAQPTRTGQEVGEKGSESGAVQAQTVGPLKVEDLEFRVEQHGFQCLVYRHKARKVVPKAVGDVTWVTQMTTDRLKIFKEMLKRWNGPVSVALYSQNVVLDLKEIESLLDRVDFHIVGASQGLYPVNTLRNVALNNARTDFVILADVDFVPSASLYEASTAFVAKLISAGKQAERKVYVLPAFEIDGEDQTVPETFEKLKAMGSKIHQVHNDGGREIAHKYTEYDRWMKAEEPYAITEYRFPYEPYVLAPRFVPRYDVRFFGYGNDKASHNYEVNAAGFEFNVFPKHFVVHVRHEQGSWVQQTFIDPKDRLSRTLTTFLQDCDRRYAMKKTKQVEKVFLPFPPSARYSAEVGNLGDSCDATCSAVKKTCRADWAERLNLCRELEAKFSCQNGCSDNFFGSDLPAYNSQRTECLINNNPDGVPFACEAKYAFSRRLCPCGIERS